MKPNRGDLVDVFAACYDDPVRFAVVVLGVQLKGWQRTWFDAIRAELRAGRRHIRALARTCHGAGKTFAVACLVLWYVSTRPGARCLTTAPSWAGVKNLLWPEIAELYNGSLLAKLGLGRMLDTEWQIRDTWYAVGAASDRPENLEGHHSKSGAIRVVDEAKAVDGAVFKATAGMLDAPETLDVWISTPSIEAGEFHARDTKGKGIVRALVTVDHLIHDPESTEAQREAKAAWKAQCIQDWGEHSDTFGARCMARYLQEAEGSMYPAAWISRALANTWELEGDCVFGVDCAGSSDGDQTAVAIRRSESTEDGGRAVTRILEAWRERDTMRSRDRVYALVLEHRPRVVRVDVAGLGKGISDALAEKARADGWWYVEEYRAADPARDPLMYLNRKAEESATLRKRLERDLERLIGPELLAEQARAERYEVRQDSRMRVIDPTPSPDLLDAVLIAASLGGARKSAGFLDFIRAEMAKAAA